FLYLPTSRTFLCHSYLYLCELHSFPTRRSSDLLDDLQQMAANGNWEDVLYPIDAVLGNFPTLLVPVDKKLRVWNGEFLSWEEPLDRKSTRLNSSHVKISYAVFCLKKKHEE